MKRRKKGLIRVLALTLCMTTTIVTFPIWGNAGASAEGNPSLVEDQPVIVGEETEWRDEFSKIFRRTDGTYVAITAGEALHYLDESGRWQDIDNTLTTGKNEQGQNIVTNVASEFQAELPTTLQTGDAVKMKAGDYAVSFKLLGQVKKSQAQVKNHAVKTDEKQAKAMAKLENKTSVVTYDNVLDDTAVSYEVRSKEIKESIVLKKAPKKESTYRYEIAAGDLTAVLTEDNRIEFVVSENSAPVFVMPAPYMFDSRGQGSHDVAVRLEEQKEGGYLLTYVPDRTWLMSKERQYPVTIDPTVQTGRSTSNVDDTTVYSNNSVSAATAGSSSVLNIYNTASERTMALIKFNSLPARPSGTAVTKSTLNLYWKSGGKDCLIAASGITSAWSESTVTYATKPSTGSRCDQKRVGDLTSLDITALTNSWYTDGGNFGVELHGNYLTYGNGTFSESFYSSETIETDGDGKVMTPYLEVEFTSITGLDSRYDMHEIDVGRAGTAYINDFTGNLMSYRKDMSFSGNVMPAEIAVLYDKSLYKDSWVMGTFSHDYKLSVYPYSPLYYTLRLPNNMQVFFEEKDKEIVKDDDGNPTKKEIWKSDSGYELTVLDNTQPRYNYTYVEIMEPSGYKLLFTSGSLYATKIVDTNQVGEPYIEVSRSGDTITSIKDGAGRVYRLNAVSGTNDKVLDYLGTGSTPLSTVTYKDERGKLTVTYPDGKSIIHTYDDANSTNLITSMKDVDGYLVKFTYTTGSIKRVSKVEEFAPDGTAGDWMTISYGTFTTTFTDSRGRKEIKQFDRDGNTISVRNEEGLTIFSAYNTTNGGRGSLLGTSDVQVPGENNLITDPDMSKGDWTRKNGSSLSSIAISDPTVPYTHAAYCVSTQNAADGAYYTITFPDDKPAKQGESFTYGGWIHSRFGAALAVSDDPEQACTYGMRVEFIKDSTVAADYEFPSFNFNPYLPDWQYKKDSFTLPCDVTSMRIYFTFDYQWIDVDITGAELQRQPLYYYTADASGSIVKNEGETPSQSANPDLVDFSKTLDDEITKDEDGNATGVIKRSVSAAGVGASYTYDKYGNITAETITDGQAKILRKNKYTAGGNYLETSTDPRDRTTRYTYDQQLGTLHSVMNEAYTTTSYSYDVMQRLTGVSRNVSDLAGGTAMTAGYTYENDRLKTISHNGFAYTFTDDKWGNPLSVKAGVNTLLTNAYKDNVSKLLDTVTFGNGQKQKYFYDSKDRLTGLRLDGDATDRFSYLYNEKGELTDKKDFLTGVWSKYKDGLTSEYALDGTTLRHSYVTDGDKIIERFAQPEKTFSYTYASNQDGKPQSTVYAYSEGRTVTHETRYDNFGRLASSGLAANNHGANSQTYWINYLYRDLVGLKTNDQIYAVDYIFGTTESSFNRIHTYRYDALGNITGESVNGELLQSYVYDAAEQLIRVNDVRQNKTILYQYDTGGNIRSRKEYAYTTGSVSGTPVTKTYTYGVSNLPGWNDVLASYDGKAITYDANANPLTYDGWSYVWEGGRQLKRMSKNGSVIDYKYDDAGIRTSKTVDGTLTSYYTIDGRITAEQTGSAWTYYRYDSDGGLLSLNWNDREYYYIKNIQGDVIGLVDESGNPVVEYAYDEWGAPLSCTGSLSATLGAANPFRYRGYYYDAESGLYATGTRYYDPVFGRFINADVPELLEKSALTGDFLEVNLFAYCGNDPINRVDHSGMFWSRAIIAAASGAIFGGIAYAIGRALRLKGKPLVALTAGFAAIGLALGLWKGVGILHSINKLIKPVIYFFSNPGKVKFGLKLLSIIQFEIHAPHHNKPIHFVIRVFLKTGQKVWEWWFKK